MLSPVHCGSTWYMYALATYTQCYTCTCTLYLRMRSCVCVAWCVHVCMCCNTVHRNIYVCSWSTCIFIGAGLNSCIHHSIRPFSWRRSDCCSSGTAPSSEWEGGTRPMLPCSPPWSKLWSMCMSADCIIYMYLSYFRIHHCMYMYMLYVSSYC